MRVRVSFQRGSGSRGSEDKPQLLATRWPLPGASEAGESGEPPAGQWRHLVPQTPGPQGSLLGGSAPAQPKGQGNGLIQGILPRTQPGPPTRVPAATCRACSIGRASRCPQFRGDPGPLLAPTHRGARQTVDLRGLARCKSCALAGDGRDHGPRGPAHGRTHVSHDGCRPVAICCRLLRVQTSACAPLSGSPLHRRRPRPTQETGLRLLGILVTFFPP